MAEEGQIINPPQPEDTGSSASQTSSTLSNLITRTTTSSGIAALPESIQEIARIDASLLGGDFQARAVPAMLQCMEGLLKTEQGISSEYKIKYEALNIQNTQLQVEVGQLKVQLQNQPFSNLQKLLLTTAGGALFTVGFKLLDKPIVVPYGYALIIVGSLLILSGWIPTAWAAYNSGRKPK